MPQRHLLTKPLYAFLSYTISFACFTVISLVSQNFSHRSPIDLSLTWPYLFLLHQLVHSKHYLHYPIFFHFFSEHAILLCSFFITSFISFRTLTTSNFFISYFISSYYFNYYSKIIYLYFLTFKLRYSFRISREIKKSKNKGFTLLCNGENQ